jgi:hypothetical protein
VHSWKEGVWWKTTAHVKFAEYRAMYCSASPYAYKRQLSHYPPTKETKSHGNQRQYIERRKQKGSQRAPKGIRDSAKMYSPPEELRKVQSALPSDKKE